MKHLLTISFLIFQSLFAFAQNETPSTLTPYFSAIIVENIEASIKWYSDVLGYEVLSQTENEAIGFKQANLQKDKALLELIELKTAIFPETILKDQSKNTKIGGFFKLGFEISNFDEWLNSFKEKEVEIHGKVVIDPNFGKRMIIIKDPDGNRIQIFGAKKQKLSSIDSKDAENIKKDLATYFELMTGGKVSESLNYIHPKLFDVVPREKMEEMITSMFNDEDMKINFDSVEVLDVPEIITLDNQRFARVDHHYLMIMTLKDWPEKEELETMIQGMKWNYGEKNVSVNETEKTINILNKSSMVAFYFQDKDHWYFLENKPEMKGLQAKFIPEEVIKKLELD